MGGIDLIGATQCRRNAGMDPSYLPVHLRFPEVSRRSLDQGGGRLLPHLSDREHPYRKGARRKLAMDVRGVRIGPAADAGPSRNPPPSISNVRRAPFLYVCSRSESGGTS